jgi:uncharacterized membrane protein
MIDLRGKIDNKNKFIEFYATHALILFRDITQMRWLLLGFSGKGNCRSM